MKKQMSSKQIAAEIAGWYGAIAILAAYALVSFDLISSDGLAFQILNLTGALGVIAIALYKNVKQSVVLNIFWGIVAIVAIVRLAM